MMCLALNSWTRTVNSALLRSLRCLPCIFKRLSQQLQKFQQMPSKLHLGLSMFLFFLNRSVPFCSVPFCSVPFRSVRSRKITIVHRIDAYPLSWTCSFFFKSFVLFFQSVLVVPVNERSFTGNDARSLSWGCSYCFESFVLFFLYVLVVPVNERSFTGNELGLFLLF